MRAQLLAVTERSAAHLALEQALRMLHGDLGELVQRARVHHLQLDLFLFDLDLAGDERWRLGRLLLGGLALGYDHAALDNADDLIARPDYVAAWFQAVVALPACARYL